MSERYTNGPVELRFGDYRQALADVESVDCLIVDAPYSERTHSSHSPRTDVLTACDRDARWAARGGKRSSISYKPWTESDVRSFVDFWAPRVSGWLVSITDHVLQAAWESALSGSGRYVFAPLPFVESGSRVRLSGDGPSSWTCWIVAARPKTKEFRRWGTLPGAYVDTAERKDVVGGKPLGLMRALVRDYSRPGDLVVDPCCGAGTTLLAAAMENRRALGSECLREHYDLACKRIAKGWTPSLFSSDVREMQQTSLLGDDK